MPWINRILRVRHRQLKKNIMIQILNLNFVKVITLNTKNKIKSKHKMPFKKRVKRKFPFKKKRFTKRFKLKKKGMTKFKRKVFKALKKRPVPERKTKLVTAGLITDDQQTAGLNYFTIADGTTYYTMPNTFYKIIRMIPSIPKGTQEQERLGNFVSNMWVRIKFHVKLFPIQHVIAYPANFATLPSNPSETLQQNAIKCSGDYHIRFLIIKVPLGSHVATTLTQFDRSVYSSPGTESLFDSWHPHAGLIKNSGKENFISNPYKIIYRRDYKLPQKPAIYKVYRFNTKIGNKVVYAHSAAVDAPMNFTYYFCVKLMRNGYPVDPVDNLKWTDFSVAEYQSVTSWYDP